MQIHLALGRYILCGGSHFDNHLPISCLRERSKSKSQAENSAESGCDEIHKIPQKTKVKTKRKSHRNHKFKLISVASFFGAN